MIFIVVFLVVGVVMGFFIIIDLFVVFCCLLLIVLVLEILLGWDEGVDECRVVWCNVVDVVFVVVRFFVINKLFNKIFV